MYALRHMFVCMYLFCLLQFRFQSLIVSRHTPVRSEIFPLQTVMANDWRWQAFMANIHGTHQHTTIADDDWQLVGGSGRMRTRLVAFSDGSTAAMGAASILKTSTPNEWVGETMAAHPSIWLPMQNHYSWLVELKRLATAGTWEVLGILLSLQLVEGYIRAMEDQCVLAEVYCDNYSVVEFCVHGSDLCYQKGARHLAPMVDLVRARIERLEETNNVVTFHMPAHGRNSLGIRKCDASLKLVRPLKRKPYPDDLVPVASHNRIALDETLSLLRRAEQEEGSEVIEIMRYY